MALSLAEIEREITRLTAEERARLIALLDPADDADIDGPWEQGLLRRSKEIEEGTVVPVPGDEALERVRRTLR